MAESFATTIDSGHTGETGQFSFNEEVEENSTIYDESFFNSSSGSSCSCSDSINRVCLNFTKSSDEPPSKVIKCKAFWKYVDSRPELEQLKALGMPESENHSCHCVPSVSSTSSITSCDKKIFWLRHLLDLKSKGLDQAALGGQKSGSSGSEAARLLYADMVEETPAEMNREIKIFEKKLAIVLRTTDRYESVRLITESKLPKPKIKSQDEPPDGGRQ